MSELPGDVWRRIMVIGVENLVLDFEDLCRLSLICKRLYKLSNEDSLWSLMLHQDFYYDEEDGTIASKKDFYKLRYSQPYPHHPHHSIPLARARGIIFSLVNNPSIRSH
ncbi:F-box domain-containing protein [Forsythia ovata]|uniref:F-box domain-containing protein n=1 Tax=Forsythia ovata TaxID=205694 RepID=A0ABD1P774_9LAMI